MYFKTMNMRFEAIEKKLDAKCDSKEVKEIVRQEMDALHTCKPNDDESTKKWNCCGGNSKRNQ